MIITVTGFGGMVPKVTPKNLNAHHAQVAENTRLWSGDLESWNQPAVDTTPAKSGEIKSIYYYLNQYWFHWTSDVDVVRSPIAGDTKDRVYYTGDGPPKKTDSSIATGASGEYPTSYYDLAVPKPSNAPSLSLVANADGSKLEDTAYVITYVTTYGEESQPSDPSEVVAVSWFDFQIAGVDTGTNTVTVRGDQHLHMGSGDTVAIDGSTGNDGNYTVSSVSYDTDADETNIVLNESFSDTTADGAIKNRVELSGMPTSETGNYNLDKKRIYRYHAGSSDGEYRFVDEVPLANTDYTDIVQPNELDEVIPSTDWRPPPDGLQGLTEMANGCVAGYYLNEVYISEPYQPHAFPTAYRHSTHYNITGIGYYGNTLTVFTEGYPYLITGVDPASMSMSESDLPQSCESAQSVVSMDGGVVYASPDGLVWVGNGGARVITRDILTKDQWEQYHPDSIKAFYWDGMYVGFWAGPSETGGFMVDPRNPEGTWVDLTYYATAGYSDLENDALYLVIDGDIQQWDASTTKANKRWKSKVFVAKRAVNFTAGRVIADSYEDLTLKIYGDGDLVYEQPVANDRIFRLPGGFRAREWEIEIEGADTVQEVSIASTTRELG